MSLLLLVVLAHPALAELPPDEVPVSPEGNLTVKRVGWVTMGVGAGMMVAGPIAGAVTQADPPYAMIGLVGGGAIVATVGLVVTIVGHSLPNPQYDRAARVWIDATTDGATIGFTTRW
jgi:hypothetical protein